MPFDPAARQIYEYYDGSTDAAGALRRRRADPIALHMALLDAAGGEAAYYELWRRANEAEDDRDGRVGPDGLPLRLRTPAALAELPRLVDVVRQAFGLVSFDPYGPGGITDDEALAVYGDYLEWCEKKRRSGAGSPSN